MSTPEPDYYFRRRRRAVLIGVTEESFEVGPGFDIKDYKAAITEEVRGYSTAKFGSLNGRACMVGALARLYFRGVEHEGGLPFIEKLDFRNPFYNNMVQAIEVVGELDDALGIVETLLKEGIDASTARASTDPPLRGVGAVEAPRGGLYNEVRVTPGRVIKYANIITPTVQNLTSIEFAATGLLKQHCAESRKKISRLMEMLVRAYDPCITCSTH